MYIWQMLPASDGENTVGSELSHLETVRPDPGQMVSGQLRELPRDEAARADLDVPPFRVVLVAVGRGGHPAEPAVQGTVGSVHTRVRNEWAI